MAFRLAEGRDACVQGNIDQAVGDGPDLALGFAEDGSTQVRGDVDPGLGRCPRLR